MPYQLHQHVDYVEVRLEGVIDAPVKYDDVAAAVHGMLSRILIDFSGVTEVRTSADSLADQARISEDRGLKVALYAPRLAYFGLARQVLQLAQVAEGVAANVFTDLEEARAWLRAG